MSLQKIQPRTAVLLLFLLMTAVFRIGISQVGGSWSNFTPVGALALFSGTYFQNRYQQYLFPILTLFFSDFLLMQTVYVNDGNGFLYRGWYWVYLAFAAMVALGSLIKRVNIRSIVLAAIGAALLHWLITDLGVWLGGCTDITTGKPFTRDIEGLIRCYALALPYLKYQLLGNLLYGTVLYGGFSLLQQRFSFLKTIHA